MLPALGSASVISPRRQRVRCVTDIGFCILCYHTRDRGYDLFQALGSASWGFTHETGGTICYGHWVLHLEITHETGGTICYVYWALPFVISHEIRGTISYRHWVLHLAISHTKQEARFASGIVFCILRYHTRNRGYDLLRALGSASCDITHESGGTVYNGHWVLRLMISRTKQGV